jgi:hypothetical protein
VGSESVSDVDSVVGTHVTSVSRNQHRRLLPRTHDDMQGVAKGGSSSSTSRPAADTVVAAVPTLVLSGGVEKSTYPVFQGVERSTHEDLIRQQIVVGEKSPRLRADERSSHGLASATTADEKSSRGAAPVVRHDDRSMPYPANSPMSLGQFVVVAGGVGPERKLSGQSPRTKWFDMSAKDEKEFIQQMGDEVDAQTLILASPNQGTVEKSTFPMAGAEKSARPMSEAEKSAHLLADRKLTQARVGPLIGGSPVSVPPITTAAGSSSSAGADRKLPPPNTFPPMPDERSSAYGGGVVGLPGEAPPTPYPFHSIPALPRPANLVVPIGRPNSTTGIWLGGEGKPSCFPDPWHGCCSSKENCRGQDGGTTG